MVNQAEQEALIWAIGISFEILPAAFSLDCFAVFCVLFLFLSEISRLSSNFEFFLSLLGFNILEKAIILMTVLKFISNAINI